MKRSNIFAGVLMGGLLLAGSSLLNAGFKKAQPGSVSQEEFTADILADMVEGRGEPGVEYPDNGDPSLSEVASLMEEKEYRGMIAPQIQRVWRSNYFDAHIKINIFLNPNYQGFKHRLNLQFMTISVGDTLQKIFLTSGGTGGSTPRGYFKVHNKDRWARSRKYNNAPMFFAHFFQGTSRGPNVFGIHQTIAANYKFLGSPASHGCVRLHESNAAWLWALTEREGISDLLVTIYEAGKHPDLSPEMVDAYYAKLVKDNPYRAW